MPKKPKKVRLFSALEASKLCGVSNQTCVNWIKKGFLEAFTTPGGHYRIHPESILRFMEGRGMSVPAELTEAVRLSDSKNSLLIVDDDKELNNVICKYLKRYLGKFRILQAFDGFEAGRKIFEERPSVIILDIRLPWVDGHELCKKIKADTAPGSPIIIAVSGMDDEKAAIINEGADAFFLKPLNLREILHYIKNIGEISCE